MNYLNSAIKQFEYYKQLGERTFAQVSDEQLFWQFNSESNSIATIVKHLAGNMRSRWTDMLTTDGEKPDRDREAEFDNHVASRTEMLALWENGWQVLLNTLHSLHEADLDKIIYIRNEAHTVMEAINRQLAHYPYHVGQIVYIGKMSAADWHSLTIPRGGSASFNASKFGTGKH
ncbi:DUF1572 domain-containing protein [Mucilaginibacter sp. 14171R-50]|uniref:DUF1572 domain-containing protein n=1 Tax=Mucilaginibacter sp. 14171R-50 TaxID=2703789 RepID=UPI00138BDA15|nr:DUF1572 domain-containing protein [Mucilaginibacter sp. 14171R-50]QHS56413.1 DUF1572 domain-containing protein [Mucilaginibacter sp. 14171R-50]